MSDGDGGLRLRRAEDDDWEAIWPLWQRVVAAGETYLWAPDTGPEEARALWMLPRPAEVWVAADSEGRIVATAEVKANNPGLGDHVANASFMVDPDRAGRGVGRRLGEHILERARALGFQAMVFNAVVATNAPALHLWQSLGFAIVGGVPDAFRHRRDGLVDLVIMHRRLEP